jgi:dTDP-glucose 4,6-dehydratase
MILVTGGAGFIGSNFILDWYQVTDEPLVNLDKPTYAGNPHNLDSLSNHGGHVLIQSDIADRMLVEQAAEWRRMHTLTGVSA